MGRYKQILLKCEDGIFLDTFENEDSTLIISAKHSFQNIESKSYASPIIPYGYFHTEGTWDTGFVIKRISDGSEFVWIPVLFLKSNGTLDGITFNEQFGRRNFLNNDFSYNGFNESITSTLFNQYKSIIKHGGFYVSRYLISSQSNIENKEDIKNIKIVSKANQIPLDTISYKVAFDLSKTFEKRQDISSHLLFGAEYDSILEWLIESHSKTLEDITLSSKLWGNFSDSFKTHSYLTKTASNTNWCANNIFDLAGNLCEFTQEKFQENPVIRGGSFNSPSNLMPVACRCYSCSELVNIEFSGFRIALYIA